MFKKSRTLVLLVMAFVLIFPAQLFSNSVDGFTGSESSGFIYQYGENGGFLDSFHLTVRSGVAWSRLPNQYTNFKYADVFVFMPRANYPSAAKCGTIFTHRNQTIIDWQTVNLPINQPDGIYESHLLRVASHATHQNSSLGSTFATRYAPFTANINNYAAAIPTPGMCMGIGGQVNDNFSITH